jgi:uncharacterized cupin superfamily protein
VNIRRIEQAVAYEAPNHFDMRALRLQGLEAGGPEKFWVGLSHILPGGHAGPDSGAVEKVYVLLSGSLTLIADGVETVLGPRDSCCIPAGATREIVNRTNDMVTMLVVIPRVGA